MKKLFLSLGIFVGLVNFVYAGGDPAAGKDKSAVCSACHGADGNSVNPIWPKLAGQNEKYLLKQMLEIKDGKREIVEMTGLLDNLSRQDLEDLAAFYASSLLQGGKAKPDLVAQGQLIYKNGIPEKGVAACTACHYATGKGIASAGFPVVGGQHANYIENQLYSFRNAKRDNDPNGMMRDIAAKMSDVEIKAVASYMQGLY